MPKFDLPPEVDNYDPQWSPPSDGASGVSDKPPQLTGAEVRGLAMDSLTGRGGRTAAAAAYGNKRIEDAAASVPVAGAVLKPLAQFANALASPDTKMGIVTGPVNGISKLGNALGDLVQGKPIDVSDAWVISDENARRFNPSRVLTGRGQFVTPSDQAGLEIGEGIGAELTGARVLQGIKAIRRVQQAAQALKQTNQVKRLAVAAKANPALRGGLNAAGTVGEALGSTVLATPFLDAQDGNVANLGDALGVKLPGRVEEGDNYLQAFGKSIGVEGLAAPLALLGAGALVKPIRKGMVTGGLDWLDELADAELAPYVPKPLTQKSLPAFGGTGFDYGSLEAPAAQYDSAIARSLQDQTQIRQVTEQRQRLQDMGLVQQGQGGQLEFSLDAGIDPEIRTQVRQLQTQRGQLIRQAMESGEDLTVELGNVDRQIDDLIQSGRSADYMPFGDTSVQGEFELAPGPADQLPEIDTFLANLDELSDAELRHVHSRVWREDADIRLKQEQEGLSQKLEQITQEIADVGTREDLTDIGRKRKITKLEKALADTQQELRAMEGRQRVPESLVGDQLELVQANQQMVLQLNEAVKLKPFREMTGTASEFGYRSPDEYRSSLQGWNRDLLRKLASPEQSPEVAALVKLRTGRRVWQAKKQDIIDALVEISQKRGRYLPPEADQLGFELKTSPFGSDTPLFDQPADLSAPGMTKTLDADGNEVLVPAVDYAPRGMEASTREQLKARILDKAIRNGEVQAPFSPLPERPSTQFDQGSFANELLLDESGQLPLAFSTDALPTYKAAGKTADTLLEEMRLRFEYQMLDAEAQRVQQRAFMAAHGWNTRSWQERKALGVMEFNPAARSDLDAPKAPAREPAPYSMTFDNQGEAVVVNKAEVPKATPDQVKAKKAVAGAEKRRAKQQVTTLDKEGADLLKQREALLRQQQGAKC